jgi:uncharacterized protein YktA (UPF0223 family)
MSGTFSIPEVVKPFKTEKNVCTEVNLSSSYSCYFSISEAQWLADFSAFASIESLSFASPSEMLIKP